MDVFASIYPALSEREALPAYYTPACLTLCLLPFLTKNKRLVSISTFPLLLYLCVRWPCYTTGDPSSDYYNNSHFIAIPLWYLDFVFLTSRDGDDAPAFVGSKLMTEGRGADKRVASAQRQQWRDLRTFSQRMKWASRLMLPAQRGIGWNWQVKGVPLDPLAKIPRWHFVRRQIWLALFFYAQSIGALAAVGFGYALRAQLEPDRRVGRAIAGVVMGWSGAVWVWDRLSCAYSLAAALGVASGVTGTWEWPPLMGALKDAWSVRQMWSVTYHQTCRRLLSQPSRHIARLLGLRRKSIASRYTQLFFSFGISCLFHQAQMFNITRKDMGELAFFMSQPLAIITEDLTCWVWRRTRVYGENRRLERLVGYIWTLLCFSLSLQFYIGGLVEARIMKDWLLGYSPLRAGSHAGQQLATWLKP